MEALIMTSLQRRIEVLQRELEALRFETQHDSLTGLGNRRFLEERTQGRGGFFVAIDLDGFKKAQDSHPNGHLYGDEVLRRFARLLIHLGRAWNSRVACRVGGDEFVVWCPNILAADAITREIQHWRYGNVTASAGFGMSMAIADRECYREKERKKRHG